MRTANQIEESKEAKSVSSGKSTGRGHHPNSRANLVAPFPKGVSGNPGGKPRFDVGAHIARAVLEENQEEAYKALAHALLKGNAYVFKELCDRGYGKMREALHISTDEEVLNRLLSGRKRINGDTRKSG